MRDVGPVTEAQLARLLHERLRPAAAGPSVAFDDVAAHHVDGEPIPVAEALARPYEPFAVGSAWGPRWGTTWFRLRGRVPEAWAARRVELRFEVGRAGDTGFGAEALVWRDGEPVQGLSPNHRGCVLANPAVGGEPVEVYVEAAANARPPWGAETWPLLDPDPGGPPLFTLARAELRAPDPQLTALLHDLRVLLEQLGALPPGPSRAQLWGTLATSARALDLDDLSGTAGAARDALKPAWVGAGGRIPHRVSAVGHAHLDTAWLWPLRETVRKCARTFSTALRLMERYPEYRFVCSQAVHLAWIKERYPTLWSELVARVAEGRFVPTGAMWVEPDCNVPSGESLVRQLVYGKRFFLDELGVETRGAWLPDTFGFSGSLPQILREAGVEWFMTQKLSWNQDNEMPHHSFEWEGIDGSRVFAHFPPADTYTGSASRAEVSASALRFKDADRASRSLYPFGFGDGGGGPTAPMLESLRRLGELEGLPEIAVEDPETFFAAARAETDDWPVWVGELYLETHRGTYTTHGDVKLANRRAEHQLRAAELWASAAYTPEAYPGAALEQAWKQVLLHQFHDILPGSGIHWVYEDSARDHAAVRTLLDDVVGTALRTIAAEVDTAGCERPVLVFNTATHPRGGLVALDVDSSEASALALVDSEGTISPLQVLDDETVVGAARVPGCGYARHDLRRVATPPPGELVVAPDRLANDRLDVRFDRDGLITSVYDRRAGREVIAAPERANRFQVHPDRPSFFDAWDIDRPTFDEVTDLTELASVEVVESGPLRAGVRFVRRFEGVEIDQTVTLEAGAARVEFHTKVDWHRTHELLKVAFPVAVHAPEATYEIQFGHLTRPTHESTSWDRAKFEVCAQQWADLTEGDYGVALLNDCKYGYDVRGHVLRLSLLRGPTWPDPQADRGRHHFTYALLPHTGDLRAGRVVEEARALNLGLEAVAVTPAAGRRPAAASFASIDAPGVQIEAVKHADRSPGTIIRLAEVWGRAVDTRLRVGTPIRSATRVDLLERDRGSLDVEDGSVPLRLRPFELCTVRVEPVDAPARSA